MWPKVWQVACMVDHVAEPGDYFEYRCGPYGVLIVRGDDGVLRAFQNACRHRGNSLCVGSGSGLRELKCGYHGWTWDLAGALKRVPNRKGFGSLRMSDFPLVPARVDVWDGTGLRQPRPRRDAVARVSGGGARRHRLVQSGRLPLLRHAHRRGRRELEDDRRRLQRDLPHPDAASGVAALRRRHPCAATDLGPHRQVRPALRGAEPALRRHAERRRGLGRLRLHPGRADGRSRRHAVPRRRTPARADGAGPDRRAHPRLLRPSAGSISTGPTPTGSPGCTSTTCSRT